MSERRRWNVGARKIPWRQRDLVHRVLGDGDRRYRDVMGSDSDTGEARKRFPRGSDVAYSLELTDEEAVEFAAASNLRYIELDQTYRHARYVARPTGTGPFPALSTLAWMRARYVDLRQWHGRDVPVAVLDHGTTAPVRAAMGFTLVGRTITSGATLAPGEELIDPAYVHGCLVAGNAVPAGGMLLDVIVGDAGGGTNSSALAAGIVWAADNGAKVVVIAWAGNNGGTEPQVTVDAVTYARDRGVQIVASAGNDNVNAISALAGLSRNFSNMHSSIAFDEATDRRALFSNYAVDASGCGPGVDVWSLDIYGRPARWNGTSASAPHMAHLLARAMTGGTFTPEQVGAAFKANTRDTGAPAAEQGGGAYDLHRALSALGAAPASTAGVSTPTHVGTQGGAATSTTWSNATASGAQADDLQLAVLVSSSEAGIIVPPGWTLLTDSAYLAGWEFAAGQTVGPTRLRVLAAPNVAGQPDPMEFSFGGGTWFSAVAFMTLRAPGGIDHERLVPTVRYGTGSAVSTVPVLPATSNDLLVCAFAQRHPSATTATLSTPAGLTSRGFFKPNSGTTGYSLLIGTQALSSAARTSAFTSTSNDSTGTWASMALTVPSGAVPIAPVTQTEPAGPPGASTFFLPHA